MVNTKEIVNSVAEMFIPYIPWGIITLIILFLIVKAPKIIKFIKKLLKK